ncbi:MAG: MlaD family protein [Deltaproteobacteria bacterium]|nr:MlaD family protein [Deltaproteobacteria bacterium]
MRKIEFKVGLFITITTLLIIGAIGFVAYKKDAFSMVHTYTLSSKTGENLTEGMPVTFWGFNIGRVSSLGLTEQGVMIQIKIPERHNRVIRANSRFILDKPLLGASRIIVVTANFNDLPLSPKTVPEIGVSNDINELIKRGQPIVDKVDKIADNLATVTSNLADPQGEVKQILKNVEAMTTRFAKQESLLEMAVGNPQSVKSLQDALLNTRDLTVQVQGILKKVDALAGKADDEIYGREGVLPLVRNILRDLLVKLKTIDTTLDNLNKISGEAADSTKDLKVLRNELDAAVISIGKAADNLDRIIPFQDKPEIKLP